MRLNTVSCALMGLVWAFLLQGCGSDEPENGGGGSGAASGGTAGSGGTGGTGGAGGAGGTGGTGTGGNAGTAGLGGSSGSGSDDFEAAYDDATQALMAGLAGVYEAYGALEVGPLRVDAASRGHECGQQNFGKCPTVSVACQGPAFSGITLNYAAEDSCTDDSGAAMKGVLVFTRNGVRDWSVQLQELQKGALTYGGGITFKKEVSGPWSVALNALTVAGSVTEKTKDDSCTKSCISEQSYTLTLAVTLSTPAPITMDVALVGDKKVEINGSLGITGTGTGSITVKAKGLAGKETTIVDEKIDHTYTNSPVKVEKLTYPLPPNCTCPRSGTVKTDSAAGCGEMTVAFAATPSGESCADATVTPGTSSALCDNTADLMESSIEASCSGISLTKP